jgi:hypothetical protein
LLHNPDILICYQHNKQSTGSISNKPPTQGERVRHNTVVPQTVSISSGSPGEFCDVWTSPASLRATSRPLSNFKRLLLNQPLPCFRRSFYL